jgi:ribulose-bisphosphate carboxylase large chain
MRKKVDADVSFCDFKPANAKKHKPNVCAFYKHQQDFRWKGVRDEPYKQKGDDWSKIMRRVLIGAHGETTKFHVRYFEISQGGNSSFEKHRHEHVVICIRGRGALLFGKKKRPMEYLDTAYISPDTPHQLTNPYQEPFGFLCIVNAKRDRPKLLK